MELDREYSVLDTLTSMPLNLYRLSPLHFPLTKPLLSNLSYHATLLAKYFKRAGPFTNSQVGTFKKCRMVLRDDEKSPNTEEVEDRRFHGILIQFDFEKKSLPAFLLKAHGAGPKDSERCIYFPLLLTSLPNSWLDVLLESFAVTFGTYAHPLQLSKPFLEQSLDSFVEAAFEGGREYMEEVIKDVSFTLDFASDVAPSLKHLDFSIKRQDVYGFLQRGYSLLTQEDEKVSKGKPGAFTKAVHDYMRLSLAMDLSHKSISIAKIACGTFVLGKDGKIKLLGFSANDGIDKGASTVELRDFVKETHADLLNRLIMEAEGNVKYIGLGYK